MGSRQADCKVRNGDEAVKHLSTMNKQCYLCQSTNLTVLRTRLRHDVERDVWCCGECDLVYLSPRQSDLKEYYAGSYRKMYSPVIGQQLTSRQTFEIYYPLQSSRLEELKDFLKPKSRVLDIGCSSGHFLYAVKDKVKECVGIEFNKSDAQFVNTELGIKTYTEPIHETDLPHGYFDVITVLQVLEHVDDPIRFLGSLVPYLSDGGHLVVEVPNIQDALLSVYKIEAYADFWYREPHAFYYSPKTLMQLLRKAGFDGSTRTLQRYNVLNQMNWIFTAVPQSSVGIGMSVPNLVTEENNAVQREINDWVRKADQEYRAILTRHDRGDCILFTGQKAR